MESILDLLLLVVILGIPAAIALCLLAYLFGPVILILTKKKKTQGDKICLRAFLAMMLAGAVLMLCGIFIPNVPCLMVGIILMPIATTVARAHCQGNGLLPEQKS